MTGSARGARLGRRSPPRFRRPGWLCACPKIQKPLSVNLFYQTFFRLFPLEQKKQGFCQNRQGMRRSLRLYFLKKYKKAAGNDFRRHFLRCENVPFHPSGDARLRVLHDRPDGGLGAGKENLQYYTPIPSREKKI